MKKLLATLAVFALVACSTYPNYRSLASKTVPTNVELIGTRYNLYTGEIFEDVAYCSGVAVSPTTIITAGHCTEAAKNIPASMGVLLFDGKIKIRTHDGRILLAEILKSEYAEKDAKDSRDVALLEIKDGNLRFAGVGDSDLVQVGDQLAIVGNSFGQLKHSFTIGVVSYVNRELKEGTFIQTDTLSAPGNSGGPVFDMNGDVVGILTRGGAGISLVIPINLVLKHLGIE